MGTIDRPRRAPSGVFCSLSIFLIGLSVYVSAHTFIDQAAPGLAIWLPRATFAPPRRDPGAASRADHRNLSHNGSPHYCGFRVRQKPDLRK